MEELRKEVRSERELSSSSEVEWRKHSISLQPMRRSFSFKMEQKQNEVIKIRNFCLCSNAYNLTGSLYW